MRKFHEERKLTSKHAKKIVDVNEVENKAMSCDRMPL